MGEEGRDGSLFFFSFLFHGLPELQGVLLGFRSGFLFVGLVWSLWLYHMAHTYLQTEVHNSQP